MLLCENGSYYTGQTKHLPARCMKHRNGEGARFTRANPPVELVYYESCSTRSEALQREHQLRTLSHNQKKKLAQEFGQPPSLKRINRLLEEVP
jgi:putative endonuclease